MHDDNHHALYSLIEALNFSILLVLVRHCRVLNYLGILCHQCHALTQKFLGAVVLAVH